MQDRRILVVDDEPSIRHVLNSLFEMRGCNVRVAASAEEALGILAEWEPEVALFDIILPGKNGIALLGEVKQSHPDIEVLMMTSKASAETAVKSLRLGASDYVNKPFDLQEVWATVERAVERRNLTLKNRALQGDQERKRRELSSTVSFEQRDANGGTSPIAEILDEFLRLIVREVDVDRANLMLTAPGSRLELAVTQGVVADSPGEEAVRIGHGIAGTVARTGETYVAEKSKVADSGNHPVPDTANEIAGQPIAVSIAIRSAHEIHGVINLGPRQGGGKFETEQLAYLSSMAGQLAATIEGTRRAEQLELACESLKAAQDQLVFSERIKAVGQMAAGVAHDFNNVLSVILARAQFMLRNLEPAEIDADAIGHQARTIIKTALQGAEAIKRVQDYTRIRKDLPRSPVDINAAIREAIEISKPKWNEEPGSRGVIVEVGTDLGDVPEVAGNRFELIQVFGNLIFNAVEAMPQGGRLDFRTGREGDRVVVQVEDTGSGMDEETKRRLFEPFFTTKEDGQGLGTSVLYGIIQRHGGEISVVSELGRGTTFRIELPRLSESDHSDTGRTTDKEIAVHRTARILLVDDDEMIRETFKEALVVDGHEVLAVDGGEAALKALGQGHFDVLITDLGMKGINGLQLSRKVKEMANLPILVCSGWSIREDSQELAEAGVDLVLPKPFLLEDLLGTVQQLLQQYTAPTSEDRGHRVR